MLATNIAETSITIDDVVYVIDCGKAKETSYDALNKLACLLPSWISKASAHQVYQRSNLRTTIFLALDTWALMATLLELKFNKQECLRRPLHNPQNHVMVQFVANFVFESTCCCLLSCCQPSRNVWFFPETRSSWKSSGWSLLPPISEISVR